MDRPYEYVEHTADVAVRAYGRTLEEAFANAAVALADITYHTERVQPREAVEVSLEHEDLEGLLFRWIDELIYLFEADKFAISRSIDVELSGGPPYRLRARLRGERYDLERHGFRGLIVKAMTYHMMEIRREGGTWVVQYVVDI